MELISRFFNPPETSFFLFGPRGTGKSTLIKARCESALLIDLLEPETFRTFSAHPEYLRERLLAERNIQIVIIDEIQKLPELLSLIHSLIEEKQGWQFVLTGSSARKLKRTGIDLLAGRVLLRTLHPFMASELDYRFSLEQALQYGLLPIVLDAPNPKDVLDTYAALYLREEVQYGANTFLALEVKNSDRIRPQDLKPLKSFQQDYPECKAYLLYRGKDQLLRDGILCLPCDEFLKQIHPTKPLNDSLNA